MAGTLDKSIIKTDFKPEIRREVFKALPTGDKYELVLYRAEHSAFNDTALPSDKEPRNPNHHLAILALSTAFWDTYLKEDRSAKSWLTSNSVLTVLEPNDIWQKK